MAYSAKVLCDSMSPTGSRLTTCELTIPRIVLAEFNTHRMFSRNSASSRAIPVKKQLEKVQSDPFIPFFWGRNQKGMQASEELSAADQVVAERLWLMARDEAVEFVEGFAELDVHKQLANRLLEPWMWQTILLTGEGHAYANFFSLRCTPFAQPEIKRGADLLKDAYFASKPKRLKFTEWHLPLIQADELYGHDQRLLRLVSAGRCARVSYLTHDGKRNINEDLRLTESLIKNKHWSPLEHVAHPVDLPEHSNTPNWHQLRKDFPEEYVREF